ncbi:MAG: DUF624 domain-containing protein [Eubacteriales bacterium]|nr:DUF624 domain-containing protein [Eubacteriales bacterium]
MNLDDIEAAEQAELAASKKKNKRSIFNRSKKERPDVMPEDEYKGHDIKGFFIKVKRNLRSLVYVNLIMVLGNFPLFFAIIALSGLFKISFLTPYSDVFASLNGFMTATGASAVTPSAMINYALYGIQSETSAMTAMSYVFFGLSALVIFTFGIVNVGTTYILRNMAKGEPIFIWEDFKYAVKRNFKQAFIFGIFDALILALIPFNIIYLYLNASNYYLSTMFFLTIVFSVIYIVMRFYIYLQMVTFDLGIGKILKNSLIFVILGIKRNIVALIGIILLVLAEFLLLFGTGGILVPLGIALPLLLLFSLVSFMKCYAAYFKMKEVMIDPYYDEDGNPIDGNNDA